jgi:hypothetical protein
MHHARVFKEAAMTESESLHPRRRLAAFAFTLLVALSIASTLAWNTSFRGNRPSVREASVQEAKAMIDAGVIAIDVRDKAVAASAHLPGAMLIPLEVLQANLPRLEAYKAHPVIVYCGDGTSRGPEAPRCSSAKGSPKSSTLSTASKAGAPPGSQSPKATELARSFRAALRPYCAARGYISAPPMLFVVPEVSMLFNQVASVPFGPPAIET